MRAPAVALLVLFAGCLSGDSPAEPVPPAATNATPGAAAILTLPDGTPVTNASDHMPHIHDYWSGRDTVVLVDDDFEPSPDEGFEATLVEAFGGGEAGRAGGFLVRPPEGLIVYEGTGEVRLTATYSDPRTTSVAVSVKDASGPEFSEAEALPSGEALAIPVTPDMTDTPHQTTSKWEFRFRAGSAPGAALGPVHVTIEVVRLDDVMLFPPHPDGFAGKDSKVVHDEPGKSAQVSYAKRIPNLVTQGEFGEHWIVPEIPIPMQTRGLRAEVTLTKAEANVGEVTEIRFFYRGADTFQLKRVDNPNGSVEEKRLVYEWQIDPAEADSPYATESQWQVLVEAATQFTGQDNTCGGCVDTEIEFHLVLTAFAFPVGEKAEIETDGSR